MKLPAKYLFLLVAVVALLPGCNRQEPITSFTRPRTARPLRPLDVDEFRARLDHTFAAVVPHEGEAWFFKLVAPAEAVDEVRSKFVQFLATVQCERDAESKLDESKDNASTDNASTDNAAATGDEQPTPNWKLPEGWRELPGDRMSAAVIAVPGGEKTLKMTVTVLPMSGPLPRYLTMNVNRWLDQLKQPAVDQATVEKWAQTQATVDGEATWFELAGIREQRDMPAGHPPIEQDSVAAQPRPPAATAVGESKTAAPPLDFKYQAPDDWQLGAPNRMRKATFNVGSGDEQAKVTVSAWPGEPGQGMGSLRMNLDRWAGEVGVDPKRVAELEEAKEEIAVGDAQGHYLELSGSQSNSPLATHVAMVFRDGEVWFFKMFGARETVEDQRGAFKEFLSTVEFAGDH